MKIARVAGVHTSINSTAKTLHQSTYFIRIFMLASVDLTSYQYSYRVYKHENLHCKIIHFAKTCLQFRGTRHGDSTHGYDKIWRHLYASRKIYQSVMIFFFSLLPRYPGKWQRHFGIEQRRLLKMNSMPPHKQ